MLLIKPFIYLFEEWTDMFLWRTGDKEQIAE